MSESRLEHGAPGDAAGEADAAAERSLAWAALLARWTEVARASAAPTGEDAGRDRARRAVVPAIELQAITLALADLDRLDPADHAFARDRAAVVIDRAAGEVASIWRGTAMPVAVRAMLADARSALERAAWLGTIELLWPGPGVLVVPAWPEAALAEVPESGDDALAAMQPGTWAMPGEPVAWWRRRDGAALRAAVPGGVERAVAVPRQVYRAIDERGRIVADRMLPVTAEPRPGLPLLVPLRVAGRPVGRFTLDAEAWRATQERALGPGGKVPVHEEEA